MFQSTHEPKAQAMPALKITIIQLVIIRYRQAVTSGLSIVSANSASFCQNITRLMIKNDYCQSLHIPARVLILKSSLF